MLLGHNRPPPARRAVDGLHLVQPVSVRQPLGQAEALRHRIAGGAAATLGLVMRGIGATRHGRKLGGGKEQNKNL